MKFSCHFVPDAQLPKGKHIAQVADGRSASEIMRRGQDCDPEASQSRHNDVKAMSAATGRLQDTDRFRTIASHPSGWFTAAKGLPWYTRPLQTTANRGANRQVTEGINSSPGMTDSLLTFPEAAGMLIRDPAQARSYLPLQIQSQQQRDLTVNAEVPATEKWAHLIVQALKDHNISLIAYVPDSSIHRVTRIIAEDPFFHLVYATREEEAVGVAVGSYAAGRNAAVFMQTSGFGNSINAVASLCIPARAPIPFFINMRGSTGEFNISQVPMGRATVPILDQFGIVSYTIEDDYRMDNLLDGAMKLCYANRQPVAICLTQRLHGGKFA